MIFFAGETLAWMVHPPFRPELVLAQMAVIGVGSTFIVATTGFFTGMVFALQVNYAMRQFGAEGYVGGSVGVSLARELGPVLTALMVIGRSGSANATELGTMRVTEQIDAMETMAVNPVQYLAVPRFIASWPCSPCSPWCSTASATPAPTSWASTWPRSRPGRSSSTPAPSSSRPT